MSKIGNDSIRVCPGFFSLLIVCFQVIESGVTFRYTSLFSFA